MSLFVRPDSCDISEMMADGVVALLRDRSVDAVNASALARWLGMSRQALNERLWDRLGARRRVIRLTVLTFADRWLGWVESALLDDVPLPALPRTDEEVHGLRVWAALTELARGDLAAGNPEPAAGIREARAQERNAVRQRVGEWLGAEPADDDVTEICALTDGLRAALIAPLPELTADGASRVLRRRLDAIRSAGSGDG